MQVFIETVDWNLDKDRHNTLPEHNMDQQHTFNTSTDTSEDITHITDAMLQFVLVRNHNDTMKMLYPAITTRKIVHQW